MTGETPDPQLSRKPLASIIAVGILFCALGVLDIARGVGPLARRGHQHLASDDLLVLAIGIVAIVAGFNVMRGRNWARWVLACWMLLHVLISAGQWATFGAHLAIFGFLTFMLFRRAASSSFVASPRN